MRQSLEPLVVAYRCQVVHGPVKGLPGQLNGTCNPYEINGTKCGSGWVVGTPCFNFNLVPSTGGLRSMHTTLAEVRGHPSGLFFRHVAGQGLAHHILSCCSQVCQARNDGLDEAASTLGKCLASVWSHRRLTCYVVVTFVDKVLSLGQRCVAGALL